MTDLSSFWFCRSEIFNDEDRFVDGFGAMVMASFGIKVDWDDENDEFQIVKEQGGSSSGCSMKLGVE
ncbi:hypothetical protein V6N12_056065 [Hibiscus sabdariffa]|uniref:Uncharacterized protein n=1 Tax=Hibiscus sabdariffa TaxID=183260 RepID=A0ABR2CRG4_9ROSI